MRADRDAAAYPSARASAFPAGAANPATRLGAKAQSAS
jgi:hypothetical protein